MSLDELRRALDELDEPTLCEGTVRLAEQLAIMLPDGDVGALDDPQFVDWLVEHGEPAPFGLAGQTRHDPRVRQASRLAARGAARVSGFAVEDILDDIEQVLSPRAHLEATLLDIIVYRPGGHFAFHKDTPRSPEQLGTLVVGLPIEHAGGAFTIVDRHETYELDWSGPCDPTVLRWVALFSDADHAIQPVKGGARVTLVYTLALSGAPREDSSWRTRLAAVHAAARRLQLPDGGPIMIPCVRHVIGLDQPQPQPTSVLRGVDRDVADALAAAGLRVAVRTCIGARSTDYDLDDSELPGTFRDLDPSFARLAQPVPDEVVRAMSECITFQEPHGADGGGDYEEDEASSLHPYVAETMYPADRWVLRRNAAVTFLREADHAPDGFIGNGADTSYLYKLAALEVTRR